MRSGASPKGRAGGLLPDAWRIQLPVFEGPLDLLLHLVRVNEVEITEIPVVLICDQFHDYLALMEELDLDIAADYVYEAAQLIFIKSRMLLPRPRRGAEESEDPRENLVQRLLEYQQIKDAAQSMAEIHELRRGIWVRPPEKVEEEEEEEESLDLGDVSLFDLLGAFRKVLDRYDREHPPPLVLEGEEYSVRGQFQRILESLDGDRPLDLLQDLRGRSCRAEAVSAFLAVLELARLRLVRLHQTGEGELLLYRTERELRIEELEAIES